MRKRIYILFTVTLLALLLSALIAACGKPAEPAAPAGDLDAEALVKERCAKHHDLARVETAKKTAEEWEELLGKTPLCCGKIRSLNEWIHHPASENSISKIETPDWGLINTIGSIITFEEADKCLDDELLPEKSVEDIPENWDNTSAPFSVQEINTPPFW